MKKFEYNGVEYEVNDQYTNYAIDSDGELWVYDAKPELIRNAHFDTASIHGDRRKIDTIDSSLAGPFEIPAAGYNTVTIKVPPELKDWFVSMMSCCVEQTLMECYAGHDSQIPGTGITFDYPHFSRKRNEETSEKCDIVMKIYEGGE